MIYSTYPDQDQRAVIESHHRTLRLVAAAGSGKTETIVARLRRRLEHGREARRMLVLTFDTSGAHSLRERISERCGSQASQVVVSTLNAFGYGLIRKYAPFDYYRILSQAMALQALSEELQAVSRGQKVLLDELAFHPAETGLVLFSLLKNAGVDPRRSSPFMVTRYLLRNRHAAALLPHDKLCRMIVAGIYGQVFGSYERRLRHQRQMDFDDQKLRARSILSMSRSIRDEVTSRYREVIVDEFQDINQLDFDLIRTISSSATLVVAGDDDQAIYGFRGCTPDYIRNLARYLDRPVKSLELRTNYRNPPNLLNVATRLIRNNRWRIPKQPIADREDEARIEVCPAASPLAEAQGIAAAARRILASSDAGTIAILYRLNAQSLLLQSALRKERIRYKVRQQDDLREMTDRWKAVDSNDARGEETSDELTQYHEHVELRTYFRAKGLQWDTVFLPGCNAGLVPYARAPVEEERRLFYVALTRASRRLIVSFVLPNAIKSAPPSQFLMEAGLLDKRWTGR